MNTSAISISRLTKDFRIGIQGVKLRAVEDLSLKVAENQIFGLLGPNGCGKSTTMKVVLGLLRPTQGKCSIFGVSSSKVESRKEVGFLPEAPYFYKFLTGFELVKHSGRICGMAEQSLAARAREVIRLVDLEAAADRRVGTYSKGMLQRIGIAQAMVHDPRLLILDEPTAGVDPIGSEEIAKLLFDLKKTGKTIFLCSHLLAQIEGLCDRIGIMYQGRLVVEGAVDELLKVNNAVNLQVENLNPGAEAAVRSALDQNGANLLSVANSKFSLDQLFLEKVREEKRV